LFSDEAPFTPAHTAAAADIILQMAGYLCGILQMAGYLCDAIRLAYLAQAVDRLAHQIVTGTGADLSTLARADQATLAATLAACQARTPSSGYAACVYSLMKPPRIGRRWTLAPVGLAACAGEFGGCWASARCGRCWL
jgi:hypothetical protein